MTIVDGKKIRDEILEEVKRGVSSLSFAPVFCDVLVGSDPASVQYVNMKKSMAENVGIIFHEANFPLSIQTEDLVKEIQNLNKIKNMCGIIVQLPLPKHIDQRIILDAIEPSLDVDCLGSFSSKQGFREGLFFPTALACMAVLESLKLDLNNKNIVVLGQGMLVGKPVAMMLNSKNLSYTTIDSKTEDKEKIIKQADVIISGIGQGKFLKGNMVKDGVVIIDAGTSESVGSIVGDVDIESVKDVASYVSPVPGGVGPVTVAMLLQNVLLVAKNKNLS